MNKNEVIKHPILTEKTYAQMSEGVYTFAVDRRTNKAEVKKVIEHIFEVKVERVNILNVNKKATKLGRFEGFTKAYKKAIVKLADGQINIFPEEATEAPVQEVEVKAKEAKAEKKEMSDAEKRAAEKIAAKKATKEEVKTETKVEEKPAKEEVKTETKVEETK